LIVTSKLFFVLQSNGRLLEDHLRTSHGMPEITAARADKAATDKTFSPSDEIKPCLKLVEGQQGQEHT
jgi:hypothetical protein